MFSASQEVRCRKFQKYQAAMLLQVHDELVFEAPAEETQRLAAMVKREMEEVYPLEVPLVADIGVGANWRDAKQGAGYTPRQS